VTTRPPQQMRLEDTLQLEDGDDQGGAAGGEGADREQQEKERVPHPVAWSTTRAVNGVPLLGVMVKSSPQWPTITSAGARRL